MKRTIHKLFYYAVGTFGSKVIYFLLVPFYSFFLSRSELGFYDLILASLTILTPIITIQVSDAVYRELHDPVKQSLKSAKAFSSGFSVILFGLLIFALVALIFNKFFINKIFYELLLIQSSFTFYIFFQQSLRGLSLNREYAFMGTINACLLVLFSIALICFSAIELSNIVSAIACAQFISIIYAVYKINFFKLFDIKNISKAKVYDLLNYSFPLLPNTLSWWLIDLGSRYIILLFIGIEENGLYAIAARYAGIIALVNSIFILSWQDYVINSKPNISLNTNYFSSYLNQFIAFQIGLVILLTSFSNELIYFTTPADFHNAAKYLPILLISSAFASFCGFYGAFYLKEKRTKKIFTTTLIGSIINIALSVTLINYLGLYAVAFASFVGFLITFLLRFRDFELKIDIKNFTFLLLGYSLVFYISQLIESTNLRLISIAVALIYFILININIYQKILFKNTSR
jgi:O-antigen/teichoic acid export membrane protein